MAARRLVIVMLILLGVSTIVGLLIPGQRLGDETGTEPTTTIETEPDPEAIEAGSGVRLVFEVSVNRKRLVVVPVARGDQLSLVVRSRRFDQVEIPAFGLIEPVGPGIPARFDLLAREVGTYGVRLVGADRLAARIEVTPPQDGESGRTSGQL